MLEEKLRQASQSHATHRKRLFVVVGLAIFITVTAIVLINRSETNPVVSSPTAETKLASPTLSAAESERLRQQFKLKLRLFETEIAPALIDANLKAWNNQQSLAIAALKDKATSAFANSDYATAIQALNDLANTAQAVLAQHADLFASEFRKAKEALQTDNFSLAKLHIDKALQLKANDSASLQLTKQIDALPNIIALLNLAAIGHTENNLQKEYEAVRAAFNLAPQRQQLKQRQTTLAKRIKENQFTPLIARGLEDVANRKLRAARFNYQQAKALYPNRSELRVLQQGIRELAISLDVSDAIKHGGTAIRQDNWSKAQAIYAAAIQRHPRNKSISEGLQLANKLVSLHHEMDAFLRQAERLASPNIAASAQDLLIQTQVFATNSPSLKQKSASLKSRIQAANIHIAVTVISDNKTYILVRGVGKVGLTESHTIQLKAGFYTFEGLRKGYKSKLVQLRIPIGATALKVEVICDERI